MPVNKYNGPSIEAMRKLRSVSMRPDLVNDLFSTDKIEKDDLLCQYGMPAFASMRGAHSTLNMAMALDSIKRVHHDVSICHVGYEPILFDYVDIDRRVATIGAFKPSMGELIVDSINAFKKHEPHLYIDSLIDEEYDFNHSLNSRLGLFPDSDFWSRSVCRYDEEKVKAYKIPSKDRLDMLVRIYKFVKGK